MKLRKTNKKGFTLVELIVVIAIIAIIAAIAIPTTIVYVGRAYDSSAQSEADSAYNTIVTFLQGGAASGLAPNEEVTATDIYNELKAVNSSGVQYLESVTLKYDGTSTLTIIVVTKREADDPIEHSNDVKRIGKSGQINVSDYELKFTAFEDGGVTINYTADGWVAPPTDQT